VRCASGSERSLARGCAPRAPPAVAPDTNTQEGKLALLRSFKLALGDWRSLLQRFLRSEDDQVRAAGSRLPQAALVIECGPCKAMLQGRFGPRRLKGPQLRPYSAGRSTQVELLLTLEEYVSCEGVFEADGGGAPYAPIFVHIVRQLYDSDVVRGAGCSLLRAWWGQRGAARAGSDAPIGWKGWSGPGGRLTARVRRMAGECIAPGRRCS
jgi:translation initiation factor eIF-2B subunit epsilon